MKAEVDSSMPIADVFSEGRKNSVLTLVAEKKLICILPILNPFHPSVQILPQQKFNFL